MLFKKLVTLSMFGWLFSPNTMANDYSFDESKLNTLVEQTKRNSQAEEIQRRAKMLKDSVVNSVVKHANPFSEEKKESQQRNGILYVFISKSVPLNTLRRYAKEINKRQLGTMVINGFVDSADNIKPTMAFTASVIKADESCEGSQCRMLNVAVDINPILFQKYNIKSVPAFVYSEVKQETFCEEDMKSVNDAIVVYGDSDIYYALEQINQHKPNKEIAQILGEKHQL